MHSDRWRGEGIVRREHERAPVLTIVIGCVLRPCDDIVPSSNLRVSTPTAATSLSIALFLAYSNMFVSEGCAVMYGGGFSAMLLYSRVNCAC